MYSSIIHPINGERVAIQSILGKKLLMNYASQLIGGTTPTNVDIHQRVMSGGAGGPVSINLQPLKTLVNSTDPREDYYEEEHPRIIHTLHKLEEFLSGEIHEEMNEALRLKEQDLKLQNLKQ